TLTYLHLALNLIADEGAQALATLLETNRILTVIDLAFNQISIHGIKNLASASQKHSTMTTLDLRYNQTDANNREMLNDTANVLML
ncbi:unnamed protein product, partial [Rotaria magnacalcarata]